MFLLEYWISVQAFTGTVERTDLFGGVHSTIRTGNMKKLALVEASTFDEAKAKLKQSLKPTEQLIEDRITNLTVL
jgi:hypothetical protein